MNPDETKFSMLRLLISKALDGSAAPDQMKQLSDLLIEDSQLRRYYLEYIQIHIGLRRLHEKDSSVLKNNTEEIFDRQLWEELARNENTAETIEIELSKNAAAVEPEIPIPARQSVRINKFSIYTVLTAAAALLLMIAYIHFNPAIQPTVAVITDTMNGRWDTQIPMQIGDDIKTEPKKLREGIIKLAFDSGVEVVIEAPAEFTPVSINKLILQKGKAFAHVPGNAIGFTIDTPGSSVVDLGTEFGIYVDTQNDSEVHVVQGKVNLIAGSASRTKQSEIVGQAEARQVGFLSKTIEKVNFCNNFFVRDISSRDKTISYGSPLNLAWVLAGSNGFTPAKDTGGIDPASGKYNPTVIQHMNRQGDKSYHVISDRPFIDGVFVPNQSSVVSSTGHQFGFPDTSNEYWSDITANPVLIYTNFDLTGNIQSKDPLVVSLYHGAQTDSASLPLIFMHSNQGITFDLDRIRQAQRGTEIVRFQAKCGVASNVSRFVKMQSEFWVLIDGQSYFHHITEGIPGEKIRSASQEQISDVKTIDIPILPSQRFLTLATTDGGDSSAYDWCIFENPVLVLAPRGLK
jgi:hypothetical protein